MVFQCLVKRLTKLPPQTRRVRGVVHVDRPQDVLPGQQGPDLPRFAGDERDRGVPRVDHQGCSRRGHFVPAPDTDILAMVLQAVAEIGEEPGSGSGNHEPRGSRDGGKRANADAHRLPQIEQVNLGYLAGVAKGPESSLQHQEILPDLAELRPELAPLDRGERVVDELQQAPFPARPENPGQLVYQEQHVPARITFVAVEESVRYPCQQGIAARGAVVAVNERHKQQLFHERKAQVIRNHDPRPGPP